MAHFSKTTAAIREMSAAMDEAKSKSATLAPALDATRKQITEAQQSFDVLDGLLEQSRQKQNNFSKDFELSIQQVRLGATDIRDFIAKWGDASIATADGMKRIRDLFSGTDLGQYRQQIQDLIAEVTSGAADLDQVVAFLKANAGDLAKGLIDVLNLFKEGKASLDDVQRALDATKKAFPGVESDALAEAIEQALAGGLL